MSKLTESLRKWSDTFAEPDHPFTGQIAQLLAAAADAVDRLETVNHTLSGQIQKALAELQEADRENRRLRQRLEVVPDHPYDGIYCRDETIRLLEKQIDRLRAELAEAQRAADLERGRG